MELPLWTWVLSTVESLFLLKSNLIKIFFLVSLPNFFVMRVQVYAYLCIFGVSRLLRVLVVCRQIALHRHHNHCMLCLGEEHFKSWPWPYIPLTRCVCKHLLLIFSLIAQCHLMSIGHLLGLSPITPSFLPVQLSSESLGNKVLLPR